MEQDRIKLVGEWGGIYVALKDEISGSEWECSTCKKQIKAGDVFGMVLLANPEETFVNCFDCIPNHRHFKSELELLLNPTIKSLTNSKNKLNRIISTLKKEQPKK